MSKFHWTDPTDSFAAEHAAAEYGYTEIVNMPLDQCADVNMAATDGGLTVLVSHRLRRTHRNGKKYCWSAVNARTATTTLHPFNGLFSRTTWVSRYQKGKTSLDLNEARDDGVLGCSGIL